MSACRSSASGSPAAGSSAETRAMSTAACTAASSERSEKSAVLAQPFRPPIHALSVRTRSSVCSTASTSPMRTVTLSPLSWLTSALAQSAPSDFERSTVHRAGSSVRISTSSCIFTLLPPPSRAFGHPTSCPRSRYHKGFDDFLTQELCHAPGTDLRRRR